MTPTPDARELSAVHDDLAQLPAHLVVERLGRMSGDEQAVAFRLLAKDQALEVFEDLDPALQAELVSTLRGERVAELFRGLDPDDRASLLDEVPATVASRLLSGLSQDERAQTTTLLGYPERSAGRRMSPEAPWLHQGMTVSEAMARVRLSAEHVETIYMLPVLGAGRRVEGVVSLRRLLISDHAAAVETVMSRAVTVRATDDEEDAANLVRDGGFIAVPVVDAEDRLLGVLTVDDAMRVLESSDDEDSALSGGSMPLRRPYLTVPIRGIVRSRIVWLLVLIVAATLTVNVLNAFEGVLEQVVVLALFMPLLIGTGGNAGSQSATTIVRALAVGDVEPRDILRVAGREIVTGALMGLVLATVGFVPALLFVGLKIALVLGVTLVCICMLATTVGAAVPLVARRLGADPAVMSAPFISTFCDATGLIIYFTVASLVLGL